MSLPRLQGRPSAGGTCCDPVLVGTLGLVQSAIHALPTPHAIASLVEAGLTRLPGVTRARLDASAEPLDPDSDSDHARSDGRIPLETLGARYGWIDLAIDDRAAFAPYEPYVQNLGNAIALHLETEFQRRQLETLALENARLLEQAREAVEDRERLLAIVSHDLKNPLTAVQLQLDRLARGSEGGELAARLRPMRVAVRQMQELIADLHDFSRLHAGALQLEKRRVDVTLLVRDALDVIRPIAEEKGVVVAAAVKSPPIEANCDPERILQVVGNLLGNAVKFTPRGGRIDAVAERAGDTVRVTVRDSGPGIPAESLPHVFDHFWKGERGDRGGLGLGLAIVKGIVESHGGRVRAESALGRGTTMQVTIPLG